MATVSDETTGTQGEATDHKFLDLFGALAAPIPPGQVRHRSQGGRQLSYITARTVMIRLDDVIGPAGWWDEYIPGENSVICKLTLCLPDGSTITKSDAGGYAGMSYQGDDDKSGFSDAFKRAAVKFGIGRELYGDGVSRVVSDRCGPPPAHERPEHRENAPSQARPPYSESQRKDNGRSLGDGQSRKPYDGPDKPPRTGRALFAWTKEQEQRHEVGLLKYLNGWAKLQDFPGRMVDWDEEQVAMAHKEAVRKLQSVGNPEDRGDAYEEALSN